MEQGWTKLIISGTPWPCFGQAGAHALERVIPAGADALERVTAGWVMRHTVSSVFPLKVIRNPIQQIFITKNGPIHFFYNSVDRQKNQSVGLSICFWGPPAS